MVASPSSGRCLDKPPHRGYSRGMKRKGRGRPDRPTIWLVPEDKTGFFVFQAVVEKRKLNAHVVLRGKAESFDKLAIEIEDVLISVLEEMKPGDCIKTEIKTSSISI